MIKRSWLLLAGAWGMAAFCSPLAAQFTVIGVEDEEVYSDRVTLEVRQEAGFEVSAFLNDEPIPAGIPLLVDDPDYYQLRVESSDSTTGDEFSSTVQFIVRASSRGNSEWGLPPWVPYPPVDSAPAEFAGGRLELVAPRAMPTGVDIPVIARVLDASDRRLGVSGIVRADALPAADLRLLRGVGSSFIPAAIEAGPIQYTGRIHGLESTREIYAETGTIWTEVSGDITSSTDWGEDARVHVTGRVTVAPGATLSIGAGSVLWLDPEVELWIDGSLVVTGSPDRPVVFTPQSRSAPWGGIVLWSSPAQATVEWTIFTGSGANDNWIDESDERGDRGGSHRDEQPLIYVRDDAQATFTNVFMVDHSGQMGHGEGGFLTMTRCLAQSFISAGQYNGGRVILDECALIEFPAWDAPFEDEDNDGLYLNGATAEAPHTLRDCLVGWALDDGIDAGSGSAGAVSLTGCWIESCYHEAMAFSNERLCTVRDTVAINCGQGIECGFDDPVVDAQRCLSTGNLVGARYGDNYDWDYFGFLTVTDSLLIYNRRDVWGRNWDDWTVRVGDMDIRDNHLTAPDPLFPLNATWQPSVDVTPLLPFLPVPTETVGVAIATWSPDLADKEAERGVPVRLSTFSAHPVSVTYRIEDEGVEVARGALEFPPGQSVLRIPLFGVVDGADSPFDVVLESATRAEITGRAEVSVTLPLPPVPRVEVVLLAAGSSWRYFDAAQDLGAAWRFPAYDDSSWAEGPAELGYGDDDEATVIDGGPSDDRHPTEYFRTSVDIDDPSLYDAFRLRLKRDDGAVVYINGEEVHRSNMPEGEILYSTWAASTTSAEDEFEVVDLAAAIAAIAAGTNVVAVEVHQRDETSSDVSFDLSLSGLRPLSETPLFVRGDANLDGAIDVSDAVTALLCLFAGEAERCDCLDAVDIDDDGQTALTDPIRLLNHLFRGQAPPAAPYASCGEDTTDDDLGCERQGPCL